MVKMFAPAAKPSQSRVTTSSPARFSDSSIACSISGRAEVRSRPMVRAGAAAGVNPGSSSRMPAMSPPTVAAIGPTVSRLGASGQTPSSGTRPYVVLSPAVPQQAEGTLIDPPVSDPSATSASPVATATAEPLDDPPGIRPASSGLEGVPNHGLVPIGSIASSCRLVLPTIRAPADRAPARQAASRSAGRAVRSTARDPAVVGTSLTSMRSLTASRGPVPLPGSSLVIKVDIAFSW